LLHFYLSLVRIHIRFCLALCYKTIKNTHVQASKTINLRRECGVARLFIVNQNQTENK
jgi:hypothetical protein